ncbi:unnamed protein product [Moneuplotes crassus]|uniref:VWFA domain-containing protein n=1 Tax=Euplotes crassus TaxID=5936 RepID=A0AAD1Y4Z8_EUPCR|nr:unnamed protein product [Moneuplotes crassus]
MQSCSNYSYIPKSIKQAFLGEEVEEIKEEEWEVHSDSLNESLDSGSDEEVSVGEKEDAMSSSESCSDSDELIVLRGVGLDFESQKKPKASKKRALATKNKTMSSRQTPVVKKASMQLKKKAVKERINRQGRVFKAEVDTNVMSIDLKVLKDDGNIASGDPVFCEGCRAVLNIHSKLNPSAEPGSDESLWKCEFCGFSNEITIDQEEAPSKESLNYLLDTGEPEAVGEDQEEEKTSSKNSEAPIIFCIDVSKSMDQPADGQKPKSTLHYNKAMPVREPPKPINSRSSIPYRRAQRHVPKRASAGPTRYQGISKAILEQIKDMAETKRKVGVVFFNNRVQIHGDGSLEPFVLDMNNSKPSDPNILNSYENLLEQGEKAAGIYMAKGINYSLKNIQKLVNTKKMGGSTALGPAAVASIAMAGKLGNGATVVICTDGLSNVGVGNLADIRRGRTTEKEVDLFYNTLADYANLKGVSVHLISIKGEHSDLQTLMTLSDKTGGDVNIIDPSQAGEGFGKIVKRATIATNVTLKVKLNRALEFRNENEEDLSSDKTLLTRKIGNVNEDSQVTFSYKIKDLVDLKKLDRFTLDELNYIPFQCIVEFTKLDGKKCIRTITKILKSSDDKAQIEEEVDIGIIAVSAAHQASNLARQGKFREAQALSLNNKKFLKKNAHSTTDQKVVKNWKRNMNSMYGQIHDQNNLEEMASDSDTFPKMRMVKASKKAIVPSQALMSTASSKPASRGLGGMRSKAKMPSRKFKSKMGDALSSNLNQQLRFNKNSLF